MVVLVVCITCLMCVKSNENHSIVYVPHLDAIQNSDTHIKFVHYQLIFVYKIISN